MFALLRWFSALALFGGTLLVLLGGGALYVAREHAAWIPVEGEVVEFEASSITELEIAIAYEVNGEQHVFWDAWSGNTASRKQEEFPLGRRVPMKVDPDDPRRVDVDPSPAGFARLLLQVGLAGWLSGLAAWGASRRTRGR